MEQEKNKQFMQDLSRNIPPLEMRELDGAGRPIPVNISLADHREEDPSNAQVLSLSLSLSLSLYVRTKTHTTTRTHTHTHAPRASPGF
jgi:hypothetical protein